MKIYSIKNEKLNFFNRPIYCESSNEALTYLQNVLMSDADRALLGLKDDLALYELGAIDFVTGEIDALNFALKVCDLSEIFASIPETKIPQDSVMLRNEISKIWEHLSNLEEMRNEHVAQKSESSKMSKLFKITKGCDLR